MTWPVSGRSEPSYCRPSLYPGQAAAVERVGQGSSGICQHLMKVNTNYNSIN